jgi:outer membrane biosynthesis protein TonB
MAHSLGMSVIAEGIENETQVQHLLHLGCEMGQGFALGQPMAARDIHGLLAVLPVVHAQPQKLNVPAVGEAPMAPRSDHIEESFAEDIEPEELPSIYSVYHPKIEVKKPKPKAKKSPPKTKTKPKVTPKSKAPKKKRMAGRK